MTEEVPKKVKSSTAEVLPKQVKYWLSEASHDCFFLVGPDSGPTETIGAMKTLLMGFSEPFRAMLQDSKLAEPGKVRLIDVDAGAFRNFLKCVYGGSDCVIPKLSFEESVKLLYIAEKYLLEDIAAKTVTHIRKIWISDDILLALSYPLCFNKDFLKKKMLSTLRTGFEDISKQREFLDLSHSALAWILQQKYLNVKEVVVWDAILKWAKHQANSDAVEEERAQIVPLLKYIRFLAMDYKDFCTNVVVSGILLKEEIDEILISYDTGNIPDTEYLCKNKKHRYKSASESDDITMRSVETLNCNVSLYTVDNISRMQNDKNSEPFCFAGFPWQLKIRKRRRPDDRELFLSVHLAGKNFWRGWPDPVEHFCRAKITVTLQSQSDKEDCSKVTQAMFESGKPDACLLDLKWSELIDPEKGYIKEDKIIIMLTMLVFN